MLQNSQHTIHTLHVSFFNFPNISFQNLTTLNLKIGEDISPNQFQNEFPKILNNAQNLNIVNIEMYGRYIENICEYISITYPTHCISSNTQRLTLPLKIKANIRILTSQLQNLKYNSELQYLGIYI